MAFLDLDIGSPVAARAAELSPRLDRADRQVVLLSRRDPLRSVTPRGPLLPRLFGIDVPKPLADPRREALRRYAVLYRLKPARAPLAAEQAMMSGVSASELALARTLIDRLRRPVEKPLIGRIARGALGIVAAGVSGLIVMTGLEPLLNSRLLAGMTAGLIGVTIAPFLVRSTAPRRA